MAMVDDFDVDIRDAMTEALEAGCKLVDAIDAETMVGVNFSDAIYTKVVEFNMKLRELEQIIEIVNGLN